LTLAEPAPRLVAASSYSAQRPIRPRVHI